MTRRRPDHFEETEEEFRELQAKVAGRIRDLRRQRKLTQQQLAASAEVSTNHVGLIEAGVGNVTLLMLSRLARGLGVPVVKLFEEKSDGAKSVVAALGGFVAELDRVARHLDLRQDAIARLTDEVRGYIEKNKALLVRPLSETESQAGSEGRKDRSRDILG